MGGSRPKIWFEREILPDLVELIGAEVSILGPASATPDDPYRDVPGAEGIVASVHSYDAALMDLAPNLKVISRTGIGYDKVDVAAATERGIAVCNAPDGPTISTAEHAATLMMMVAKNVKRSEAELRCGGTDFYARHVGIELEGTTLGLVGFGRIARRLGTIARGLGMSVSAYDPYLEDSGFGSEATRCNTLAELVSTSDVVSIHVPLTDETAGLFGAELIENMKRESILVNTARGGLVDSDALIAALDSGHLFGAGLDVTDPEPLPSDHPLLSRHDIVVTPHVAAGTSGAKRRIFADAFEQVLQVLDGRRPPNLINSEVWGALAGESR